MADNTTLNAATTSGDVLATDDIAGVKYPRSKIVIGADGTNDGDVSATNPMPVSLSSVPSHNVTNAGTFPVQVDGAALTSLQLIDDVVFAEDAAHSSGDKGMMLLTVRADSAAATSGTTGDYQPLLTDSSGRLWANVSNTVTVTGTVAATQSGTWNIATVTGVTTVSTVTNLSQMGGVAIAMGTGVRTSGTQRVTIATDDIVPSSQSGTWTVQPGNTANTTPWLVSDTPSTSGGVSNSSFLSTAAVQSTAVKASAGQVYSIEFFNVGTSPVYVRLYNQATAPGSGDTANIIWRGVIPADSSGLGAGLVKAWEKGLAFSTGIGMRVTAAVADNDATSLSANTVLGNVSYK